MSETAEQPQSGSPDTIADTPQLNFQRHIAAFRSAGPAICRHVILGEEIEDGPILLREDPSDNDATVSGCHEASPAVVNRAVAAARDAFPRWASLSVADRVERLRIVIDLLTEQRREEIAARVATETGKNHEMARFDVLEVESFLRIYCDYAEEKDAFVDPLQPAEGSMVSTSVLRPYGVFAVIVPFNYPLALTAGPSIAAMLAGNTVVAKPAHLGPRSGHAFYELLRDADLPAGVFNVVHGGDVTGEALTSAEIDGVAFTGSAQVGRSIMSKMQSPYPRPVIAEMSGKNPALVMDSADLDQAVDGIVFSAFDVAGQKCSACSRVIATPGIYDQLVDALASRAEELSVGDPLIDPQAYLGPVITAEAMSRYKTVVATANEDGTVAAGGRVLSDRGYFVAPTVVGDLPLGHPLTRDEHFVPFLTVTKADNFDQALKEANHIPFGLTAGIYTGDDTEAERFLSSIEAGSVDVNNPKHATTGWWPGNQTFGGWKSSGSTGKQAYGRWYVPLFARQQCRSLPRG